MKPGSGTSDTDVRRQREGHTWEKSNRVLNLSLYLICYVGISMNKNTKRRKGKDTKTLNNFTWTIYEVKDQTCDDSSRDLSESRLPMLGFANR